MEIIQEYSNQLMLFIPVALVIAGVILVFTFGFKPAAQPPFHNLTTEDRKALIGKKKKPKEKKSTANGHVLATDTKHDKSPKKSPSKEVSEQKQDKKEKKSDNKPTEKPKKAEVKVKTTVEDVKNKKASKKVAAEKPVDFDDGNWETVPSKADKKKKVEQSPAKKDKKSKKVEKVDKTEIENIKVVVNDVLEDKEPESFEKEVEETVKPVDKPVVVEEKKDKKKKEKKPKKDVVEKPSVPEPVQNAESEAEPVKTEDPPLVAEAPDAQAGAVFDELGDTWTDAKVPKKSKKKARRDN